MSLPYYEMHGQAGQPLVLLPGFATDLASWIFQREELARRHRLLLLDPRGVGRSPGPPFPTTTRAMAEEVLKVMDAAAFALARENRMPIIVFSLEGGAGGAGAIEAVLRGAGRSTVVTS